MDLSGVRFRLTIKLKILLIATVALLGFLTISIFQYITNSANEVRLNDVKSVHFPVMNYLQHNIGRLDKIKVGFNAAAVDGDEDMLAETEVLAKETRQAFIAASGLDQKLSSELQELVSLFNDYYEKGHKLTVAMIEESISREQVQQQMSGMVDVLNRLTKKLTVLNKRSYDNFIHSLDKANSASESALEVGMLVGLVSVVTLLLTALIVSKKIELNLNNVVMSLEKTADGDLTGSLHSSCNDEVGDVVNSCNILVSKLRMALSDVAHSASSIASSADNLLSTAEQTRSGAKGQQQRLDQVATASNQMTSSIQEVSVATADAASAAETADIQANKGDQQARQTRDALNRLDSAIKNGTESVSELQSESGNIGQVLDVIRGIAEQTNLLALNAAIEAARAGEAGRGFAVVADEVRTLASRTQEATAEIQSMIENLQTRSQHSVSVMDESSKSSEDTATSVNQSVVILSAMSEQVRKINDLNLHIATATEEQTAVAEEINRNIHEINDFADETVLTAEKTSNESRQLADLSALLATMVGQFKI